MSKYEPPERRTHQAVFRVENSTTDNRKIEAYFVVDPNSGEQADVQVGNTPVSGRGGVLLTPRRSSTGALMSPIQPLHPPQVCDPLLV